MIDFPLGLRHALEAGECVLFIGAGIGNHLKDPEGNPAPDGMTLARDLARYFSIDIADTADLAKVAAVVELRKGRTELEAFLTKRLANLEPDTELRWLFSLRWRAIFTTNFDYGIQRAYELIATPPQTPITITTTANLVSFDARFEVPIYHLHGTLFGPDKPQIIITEDDYARFRERRRMLFELLKKEFATSSILYIGYANRDPNWKTVLDELRSEFYPAPTPKSYRIAPSTDPLDNEILRAKNIDTIPCTYAEFSKVAALALADSKVDPTRIQQIKSTVPADFNAAFEKSPAAVVRLLSSWIYVNQAPFHETPNLGDFLKGDRPNWGLIGERLFFERDLEEEIYDDLLDYATSTSGKPKVSILLGPAGYGVSTLMMALATRLVRDRAGTIFMLRSGHCLLEGDIEFSSSLFPQNLFFFVENAADYAETLNTLIGRLRAAGRSALFILGERLNEWRQKYNKPTGKEFALEPLSDPEIYRLLDYLEKQSSLGALQNLNRELQFAAIKEKHRKELLVVMRESTEGKSFDAIIEDEFRGIADPVSRLLYLRVCFFYQHGAYIRDALLAELFKIPLVRLYEITRNATEGVVVYDCLDSSKASYGARARHRTIAAIVWERCGDSGERERIIAETLSALNLNYQADKDAFDCFVRSDRIIDSIRTLDGKIRFFDTACQKDPDSPYVRQHYARMLLRADKTELALSQIDEALRINPHIRVLHHTRGLVLSHLALTLESQDLARRRLAQSEESYRRCLNMAPKDEYGYQGLAQLYFGWAKKAREVDEAAAYIAKAEEIISQGLRNARERDGLWIESANIQEWLGNQPSRIRALEKAVRESPGSIVARYMLGRAYRKLEQPEKAIEILDPVIKNHPEEFRAFVEYALALLYLGRSYKEAIAVLKISTLYGLSDPRFVATLGGMLFLNHQFTEAQKIFEESYERQFTSKESSTIQFRPPDPSNVKIPLRLRGKVVVVKAGYSLIESIDYLRFLCPGSQYGGIIMQPGLEITFEPAFRAKGSIAYNPQLIRLADHPHKMAYEGETDTHTKSV